MVKRLFGQFFLSLMLFVVALLALFFLCTLFAFNFQTAGDRIWHTAAWYAYHYRFEILYVCLAAGFLYFLFRLIRETVGYLTKVIDATALVLSKDEDMVTLPDPLKDVETRLNQIKLDLARSERAAHEAEQRKNDLIVYLAHDLKTPLTSVIGYLTLLRDEMEISPELREKFLNISLRKAERLEELINEFFEITRFNLTRLTLETRQVNLTRMLQQLVSEFQPILDEKAQRCILTAPPELVAEMDVGKMQRVFDNILRNASNYGDADSEIGITLQAADDAVVVCVQNTGMTIPHDKLIRVFDQFFRLDAARTSSTGGAGLGLAIAKEIVELHGGTIVADSAGGTTVFTVTLPEKVEKS